MNTFLTLAIASTKKIYLNVLVFLLAVVPFQTAWANLNCQMFIRGISETFYFKNNLKDPDVLLLKAGTRERLVTFIPNTSPTPTTAKAVKKWDSSNFPVIAVGGWSFDRTWASKIGLGRTDITIFLTGGTLAMYGIHHYIYDLTWPQAVVSGLSILAPILSGFFRQTISNQLINGETYLRFLNYIDIKTDPRARFFPAVSPELKEIVSKKISHLNEFSRLEALDELEKLQKTENWEDLYYEHAGLPIMTLVDLKRILERKTTVDQVIKDTHTNGNPFVFWLDESRPVGAMENIALMQDAFYLFTFLGLSHMTDVMSTSAMLATISFTLTHWIASLGLSPFGKLKNPFYQVLFFPNSISYRKWVEHVSDYIVLTLKENTSLRTDYRGAWKDHEIEDHHLDRLAIALHPEVIADVKKDLQRRYGAYKPEDKPQYVFPRKSTEGNENLDEDEIDSW